MVNKVPKAAVITRTKNRPLLLKRAIKSVLAQSFDDLVMVIVNDGGDPAVVNKLVEACARPDKIQIVHNQQSLGMGQALNRGVEESNSEYVAVLDDDDTWHKDFLKETIGYMEANNTNGVVTASELVYESIEKGKVRTISREPFLPETTSINIFRELGQNCFPIHAFIYRRSVIKKIGPRDPKAAPVDDWDFNIRFIRQYELPFINKRLVYYHQRKDSTGVEGNSIFLENDQHLRATTYVLNKYLREDLEKGTVGTGIIANLSFNTVQTKQIVDTRLNEQQLTQNHINNLTAMINNLTKELEEARRPAHKQIISAINRRTNRKNES